MEYSSFSKFDFYTGFAVLFCSVFLSVFISSKFPFAKHAFQNHSLQNALFKITLSEKAYFKRDNFTLKVANLAIEIVHRFSFEHGEPKVMFTIVLDMVLFCVC